MTKYVFVTGGVVSGLGKGIVAASLGRLLKLRGYKVAAEKFDPYMNIDPGTMNPIQHGEVFVTDDGAETDLDLGHYERFIDESLNKYANLTSGKVFQAVIEKERRGEYLGQTVQIIPHVTNETKAFIYSHVRHTNPDILITEIGGTIGDIESEHFLEAIRQFALEVGRENCVFIHVCLVPYIKGSDEYKSKPTQHSVHELQAIGINPDIIVTRSDTDIGESMRKKIALFCNVSEDSVISDETLKNLYETPVMLHNNGLDSVVCRKLHLKKEIDMTPWEVLVEKINARSGSIKIALVGKYVSLHDAYISVVEALYAAGYEVERYVDIKWVDSETLTDQNIEEELKDVDGVILPGGFGFRGTEGMITTCKYCRTHNVPYFGICFGMQIAVIEYARNVCNILDATSAEFDSNAKDPVIHLLSEQDGVTNLGGTMRLGAIPCKVFEGTKLSKMYDGESVISERCRHRYEVNNKYREILTSSGLIVSARFVEQDTIEAIELENHPFYFACQFHPEFKSRPNRPNPIFVAFLKASMK